MSDDFEVIWKALVFGKDFMRQIGGDEMTLVSVREFLGYVKKGNKMKIGYLLLIFLITTELIKNI
ncbi:MAG: hypothetical protein O8C66_06825 [Candidatus Methanoperedens sp.]|nr:hypothetical protein [Candidatus Methanoperedens sp.]